ncbi:MAG: hypothetical protein ACPIA2_16520, partial [Mariniblastus sp.]
QHDIVVQLSDWTNEDPLDVLKNLKKDGEWYTYKKDSVISLQGYLIQLNRLPPFLNHSKLLRKMNSGSSYSTRECGSQNIGVSSDVLGTRQRNVKPSRFRSTLFFATR